MRVRAGEKCWRIQDSCGLDGKIREFGVSWFVELMFVGWGRQWR